MDPLTLFGGLLVLFAICTCYLVIKLPRGYWLRFALIPVLLSLCLSFAYQLPTIEGSPRNGYPTQEFTLVTFKIVSVGKLVYIEAWVSERGRSRLYSFPFTKQTADALAAMAAAQHRGVGVRGKFGKPGAGPYGTTELSTNEVPATPLPPKGD
jgi:hypothetical protein